MTSFAERRRETHHFVGATMLGICLAVVVWIVVGGTLLQHVGLPAAPRGSAPLLLIATALSVTGLLLLFLRASRGRLTETASDGVAFGLVLGNVFMIALFGLVRFYPTLP